MANSLKGMEVADLLGLLIAGVVIILLFALVFFPKIFDLVFGSGKCEVETTTEIGNFEGIAQQTDLANVEKDAAFKFDDKCIERISSSNGVLSVKFKSNENEQKFSAVKFSVANNLIVQPGIYKVGISSNKVEITAEKVPEQK